MSAENTYVFTGQSGVHPLSSVSNPMWCPVTSPGPAGALPRCPSPTPAHAVLPRATEYCCVTIFTSARLSPPPFLGGLRVKVASKTCRQGPRCPTLNLFALPWCVMYGFVSACLCYPSRSGIDSPQHFHRVDAWEHQRLGKSSFLFSPSAEIAEAWPLRRAPPGPSGELSGELLGRHFLAAANEHAARKLSEKTSPAKTRHSCQCITQLFHRGGETFWNRNHESPHIFKSKLHMEIHCCPWLEWVELGTSVQAHACWWALWMHHGPGATWLYFSDSPAGDFSVFACCCLVLRIYSFYQEGDSG